MILFLNLSCSYFLNNPDAILPGTDDNINPVSSLHAMLGTIGYQTICILGQIKGYKVAVLVSTGGTHNFVDYALVKVVGLLVHWGVKL